MISKKLYLLALAVMASFLVAGCGEGQQKSETAPGKDQANRPVAQQKYEPAYGDMIIRGSIGDASVLLPVLANDAASFDIIGLIYNGLVKYDKDLKLVPDLAEKWEISEDKLTIRFYLRKDVKWQDGKPFTSDDVELTYNVIVDKNTPTPYATDFLKVTKFHKLDPYTVEVTYRAAVCPGPWFLGPVNASCAPPEGARCHKEPFETQPCSEQDLIDLLSGKQARRSSWTATTITLKVGRTLTGS